MTNLFGSRAFDAGWYLDDDGHLVPFDRDATARFSNMVEVLRDAHVSSPKKTGVKLLTPAPD
jgi:hypothetical protein